MPYYHKKDKGKIHFWRRKCSECSRRWPFFSLFALSWPSDMYWEPTKKIEIGRGETQYSKWGDRIPGVGMVASKLPNWPRWARLLSFSIFILIMVVIAWIFIRGL